MALKREAKRAECLKILGLQTDATEDDIKKAYKSLALLHHPDKNENSKESTEKFQEISQAYLDLTTKYSKKKTKGWQKNVWYCPDCGRPHYGEESDDEEDEFEDDMYFDDDLDSSDDDEGSMSWFFNRLFMNVFSEFVFKRRFQSKRRNQSQKDSDADKEEDTFFSFLFKKYRSADDPDYELTEEDLQKFHSYEEWLKDRDPQKRHNQRVRKAKKKANNKIYKEKPKQSKKQLLAEQNRREKEMKQIGDQIQTKVKQESKNKSKPRSIEKSGGNNVEAFVQEWNHQPANHTKKSSVERQEAREKTKEKKQRRKEMKEAKKQVRQEALKRLQEISKSEDTSKEIKIEKYKVSGAGDYSPGRKVMEVSQWKLDPNIMTRSNKEFNVASAHNTKDRDTKSDMIAKHFFTETNTKEDVKKKTDVTTLQNSIWDYTPPKSQAVRDSELLERHLQQYHELMKIQPERHTEQQIAVERSRQKERQAEERQKELEQLRQQKTEMQQSEDTTKVLESTAEHTGGDTTVDEEFERIRREQIKKQQELERKRNEEEMMQIKSSKKAKWRQVQIDTKWYEKDIDTIREQADVKPVPAAPLPSSNIWQQRVHRQSQLDSLRPQNATEEEELIKKALELSLKTAHQEEEQRKYRDIMSKRNFIPAQLLPPSQKTTTDLNNNARSNTDLTNGSAINITLRSEASQENISKNNPLKAYIPPTQDYMTEYNKDWKSSSVKKTDTQILPACDRIVPSDTKTTENAERKTMALNPVVNVEFVKGGIEKLKNRHKQTGSIKLENTPTFDSEWATMDCGSDAKSFWYDNTDTKESDAWNEIPSKHSGNQSMSKSKSMDRKLSGTGMGSNMNNKFSVLNNEMLSGADEKKPRKTENAKKKPSKGDNLQRKSAVSKNDKLQKEINAKDSAVSAFPRKKNLPEDSQESEGNMTKNVPLVPKIKKEEILNKPKTVPVANFKPNFIKPSFGSDRQEENLPILTRNEENLRPNLKIHVESQQKVDENWNDEIEEFCIPVKTPTTFDKYVRWQNMEKAAEEMEGRSTGGNKPSVKSPQTTTVKSTENSKEQNGIEKALPVVEVEKSKHMVAKKAKLPEPNAMEKVEKLREVNSRKFKCTESLLKPVVNKPVSLPPKVVPVRSGFGSYPKKCSEKIADIHTVTEPLPSASEKKGPSPVLNVVKQNSEDWDTEVFDEKVIEITQNRSSNHKGECSVTPAFATECSTLNAPTKADKICDNSVGKATQSSVTTKSNITDKEVSEIHLSTSTQEKLMNEAELAAEDSAIKALDEKLDQILQMKAKSTSKPAGKVSSMLDKMSKIGMNPNPIHKQVGNNNVLNTSSLPLQTESNDEKSSKPMFRQRPMKSVSKHSPVSQLANSMVQSVQKTECNKPAVASPTAEVKMDTMKQSSSESTSATDAVNPQSLDAKEDHRLPALKQLSQTTHTRYNDYQHLPRMPRMAEGSTMAQQKNDQHSVSQHRKQQASTEALPTPNKLESASQSTDTRTEEASSTSSTSNSSSTSGTSSTGLTQQVPNPASTVPGLPPHLVQAYLQYLQQCTVEKTAASMGVIPNMLGLPLLPAFGAGLFPGMMPLANPLIPLAPTYMGMPCNVMQSLGTVPPALSNVTQALDMKTNNTGNMQSSQEEATLETVDPKFEKKEQSQNETSSTSSEKSKNILAEHREVTAEEFWLSDLKTETKQSQKIEAGVVASVPSCSANVESVNITKFNLQTNPGRHVSHSACSVKSDMDTNAPITKQNEPKLQDDAILSYRLSPTHTDATKKSQHDSTKDLDYKASGTSSPLRNHTPPAVAHNKSGGKDSESLYRARAGSKAAENLSSSGTCNRNTPYTRKQTSGHGSSGMQIPDLLRKKKEQTMRVQEMLNKLNITQRHLNQQDLEDNPLERWA